MRDAKHKIRYMRNRVRGGTVRTYADACRYKRVGMEKSAYGGESGTEWIVAWTVRWRRRLRLKGNGMRAGDESSHDGPYKMEMLTKW